jgi:excisionase family DNA binding protein
MSSNIAVRRKCEFCGNEFTAKKTVTRFCGLQCNRKFYKLKIKNEKIKRSNLETNDLNLKSETSLLANEILTVEDVAKLLKSSKSAVYDMINSSRLKSTKLSVRKTRVLRSDFLALFEQPNLIEDQPVKEKVKKVDDEIYGAVDAGYRITELMPVFEKSRDALYTYLKKNNIPRIKVGKEILLSKEAVNKLFRKFKEPKSVGNDAERKANLRMATKGLKVADCYSIEECVVMFGKRRELLYGIFNRREVPKLKVDKHIYVSKKAVDRILRAKKGGQEL